MVLFALNYLPRVFNSTEIIIITAIYKRLRPLFYRLQEVGMSVLQEQKTDGPMKSRFVSGGRDCRKQEVERSRKPEPRSP
jgi:hypothetical protein